ncbi:NPCBM/NEW2 domain-containing protein [Anatilimnocola floriformis]|uniref:NPCBM/NEW2 domain-containing protein n=1 Tax=Anatilimnocola floriformis TaxID=2948575 RepID=UPI0020C516E7|nr:NPCBM/NEW2 domain-containing protein [Anatilimnocola floriformis]
MGIISVYAVLALATATPAADVQVKLLRGSDVGGHLVAASAEKLTLKSSTGEQTIPATQLRSVEFARTNNELEKIGLWLELIDGSQIAAAGVSLAAGKAVIELVGGDKLPEIPARAIRAVRFGNNNPALTDQWKEILRGTRSGDVLVLRKSVTREIEETGAPKIVQTLTLDELEGSVLGIAPDSVKFNFDGDKVDVKVEKLEGIIFFQPVKRELPPAAVRMKDRADSDWHLRSLELQGEEFVATTPAGVMLRIPLAQIRRLDFSAGNEAMLAELPMENSVASVALLPKSLSPAAAEWFTPTAGKRPGVTARETTVAATNVNLTGASSVTYRVPEGFKKFCADVLLVSKAGTGSDVEIVVLGDGKPLITHRLLATGERKPLPLDIDVSKVKRLTLQANSESQGLGALVDFQEARFTK